MGFPRQEYWSGLPFPSPGDLPDAGIEPASHVSCIDRQFFTTSVTWEALLSKGVIKPALEKDVFPETFEFGNC